MRQSVAAVALIVQEGEGEFRLLLRWNAKWGAYSFVGGRLEPPETFRDCLCREIGEELHLELGRDFTVADDPVAHLEYTAWSESARAETRYVMQVFRVELADDAARTVVADPDNRWLTAEEIRRGECADGRRVSPTVERVLSMLPADA